MTDEAQQDLVFCRYERQYFPAAEFRHDRRWGLVHQSEVGPLHSRMGTPVDEEWELENPGGA